MIDETLLRTYDAFEKKFSKGDVIFRENTRIANFYQLISGSIKMNNYSEKGQESIQATFKAGDSFGEPALLGDFPLPANAVAIEDVKLLCLEKSRFFDLLRENNEVSMELLSVLSRRLRFKAIMAKEIKGAVAEERILTLLNFLKENANNQKKAPLDMTRQTIANLTGLRVETVIRIINKLKNEGELSVINRKIYL